MLSGQAATCHETIHTGIANPKQPGTSPSEQSCSFAQGSSRHDSNRSCQGGWSVSVASSRPATAESLCPLVPVIASRRRRRSNPVHPTCGQRFPDTRTAPMSAATDHSVCPSNCARFAALRTDGRGTKSRNCDRTAASRFYLTGGPPAGKKSLAHRKNRDISGSSPKEEVSCHVGEKWIGLSL